MSAITGMWSFNGNTIDAKRLQHLVQVTAQYEADHERSVVQVSAGTAFHTVEFYANHLAPKQPEKSGAGTQMMWNGRLDNREDLVGNESAASHGPVSDIGIVHALYDREGARAFARINGDWALSVSDSKTGRLMLAVDYCGVRRLYFSQLDDLIVWSSDLRVLVFGLGRTLTPNPLYVAEYLEAMPEPRRTPYMEIHAVAAGHVVEIDKNSVCYKRYWDWNADQETTYTTDGDYQEQFVYLFRQSIKRRLRSHGTVMAELSGGIDSSSVVCVGDELLKEGNVEANDLRTISCYDDDEPTCDERPYFSIVENKRHCTGFHINTATLPSGEIALPFRTACPVYPQKLVAIEQEYARAMQAVSAQTLLSGFGGDEFLGGVPTGIPELTDLFRSGQFGLLRSGLENWSKYTRSSLWSLMMAVVQEATRSSVRDYPRFTNGRTSLLSRSLEEKVARVRTSKSTQWLRESARPSQRMFVEVWCAIVRQLAYRQPAMFGAYDRTYPFLDRDLLIFLFTIPRSQIIRAGERRSLLRRSLSNTVPHEVLWRKNKAVSSRTFMRFFSDHSKAIRTLVTDPTSKLSQFDYIDGKKFATAFNMACNGLPIHNQSIMRAIGLGIWLESSAHGVLPAIDPSQREARYDVLARMP